MKKTLQDLNFENKQVLVRVDFNVPITNGMIDDDNRIQESLATINYLVAQNAKVILLSHLGRIKTAADCENLSLKVVAQRLSELLKQEVIFINEIQGPVLEAAIANLKSGQVLLMENTRFADLDNKRESGNDANLAKYWASLGDIFVNDAFGVSHRSSASNVGIANYIGQSCLGLLVEKELTMLGKAVHNPRHPLVVILGGSKVSDKISVIDNLLQVADKIIIGGAMSYTFLKAQGFLVGKSLVETDKIALAKEYLEKAKDKIVLPVDHIMASEFADKPGINSKDANIDDNYMGLDIGIKTQELFKKHLDTAKTVIWNGPVGVFEMKNFAAGTISICQNIAQLDDAFVVIGGGDSAAAAIQLGFQNQFNHISTGGGASLVFLEGKTLPGIAVIQDK